jgi:hypothetical protein
MGINENNKLEVTSGWTVCNVRTSIIINHITIYYTITFVIDTMLNIYRAINVHFKNKINFNHFQMYFMSKNH